MNLKKENIIFFGSEKNREKQKYQDCLYIAFMCQHNPCQITVTCQFEKSMKEKQEEIKQLINKAKFEDNENTNMGRKINRQYQIFTLLSPESKQRQLDQVQKDLSEFYFKNRKEDGD